MSMSGDPHRVPPGVERRFEVLRFLGSGAEGRVYLARDRQQGAQPTALKILDRPPQDPTGLRTRLGLLSRIDHPNLARVLDFQVDDPKGGTWMAREYVQGEDLSRFVARTGRKDWEPFAAILRGMAAALVQLHGRGIPHGDLRPANILCASSTEGPMLKLIDGGVVSSGSQPRLHQMERQDLRFAGAALYSALTGREPERRVPPRALNPAIPRWIERLVLKLLIPHSPDGIGTAELFLEEVLRLARSGPRGGRVALPLSRPRLIGREAEWKALKEKLDRVAAGGSVPGATVLTGPEGTGKTALLRELQVHAQARGVHVFLARSTADGSLPYDPLIQVTQGIAARHGWRDPLLTGRPRTPAEVSNAFVRILRRAARVGPCVIAVDDAHQVTPGTHDLLWAAVKSLGPAPALFLIAGRGNGWSAPGTAPLALGGLDAEGVAGLIRGSLGLSPDDTLVRRAHRLTGGNPSFVLALLDVLKDRLRVDGKVVRLPRGVKLSLPREMDAAARTMARRLTRPELQAARILSAHPGFLKEPVCREMVGVEALSAMVRKGVLHRTGLHTLEWSSSAVRSHFYEKLSEANRRKIHGRFARAGRVWMRSGALGTGLFLAYHLARSARPAQARGPAVRTARLLERALRHREAAEYYQLALRLTDKADKDALVPLLQDLRAVCRKAGLHRLGKRASLEVLRLRRRLIDYVQAIPFVRAESGPAAVVAFVDDALASRCRRTPGAMALLYAHRAHAQAHLGTFGAAVRSASRAEVYLSESRDPAVAVDVALALGSAFFLKGDLKASGDHLLRGLRMAKGIKDEIREAYLCDNLAMIFRAQLQLRRSLVFARRSLVLKAGHGLAPECASTQMVLGGILVALGDYSKALVEYSQAHDIFERYGDAVRRPYTSHAIGEIHLACEDHPRALEWFDRAIHESQYDPRIAVPLAAWAGKANIYLQTGDYAQAGACLREADGCPRSRPGAFLTWVYVRIHQALAVGDVRRASQLMERAWRLVSGSQERSSAFHFLMLRAKVALAQGRPAEAVEQVESVARSAQACGARPFVIEAKLLAAEAHHRSGAFETARRLLQEISPSAEGLSRPSFKILWTLLKACLSNHSADRIRRGLDAYRLAGEFELKPLKRQAAFELARAYEAAENYPAALRYYKEVRDHAGSQSA